MGILDRIAGTLDELVSPRTEGSGGAADPAEAARAARALAERGDTALALAGLSEQIERHPQAAELVEARGEIRASTGDLEGAVADLGRVVALEAGRAGAWVSLGEALVSLGRWEPARDALRRASTLSTLTAADRLRVLLGLGEVYGRLGQPAKAVRELRRSVEQAPEDARAVSALGRALLAGGDLEGADWLARAARLPGGAVALLVEAAVAKAAAGAPFEPESPVAPGEPLDADPALGLLREAVARAPGAIAVRAALARRLAELGDRSSALREAEAAAQPAPDASEGARRSLAPGPPGASRGSEPPPPSDVSEISEALAVLGDLHLGAGHFAAALEAARRQEALGRPPGFERWLAIALGARDLAGIDEALRHGHAGEPGYAEALALRGGTADVSAALALARMAPDEPARRFVLGALAPADCPPSPPSPTSPSVLGLLTWARDLATDRTRAELLAARSIPLLPLALPLVRALEAFDRPLLLAVMGEFNAGKSSFVNALAGDDVARVGVTPTTATINILRYGPSGGGRVRFQDGAVRELLPEQVTDYLATLDDAGAAGVRSIEVYAPAESLRHIEIVDTPGLNALRAEHERVAREFIEQADGVVWVFAFGQAAKASERAALELLHAAGKSVLGVVNKVDGAGPDEVSAVLAHVAGALGDRLARLLPFSARLARKARLAGQARAGSGSGGAEEATSLLAASGLPAVQNALDELFLGRARLLKQATALAALRRFSVDAQLLATAAQARIAEQLERIRGEESALRLLEAELRSTVDAERVALRARIERAMRATAADVREFVRPGAWPFAEHRIESASEAALAELLDDAVGEAVDATARRLAATVVDAPAVITAGTREALLSALGRVTASFAAYVRGHLEGAAAIFLRVEVPRLRLEIPALAARLAAHAPSPDQGLFQPLARSLGALFRQRQVALAGARSELELERLAIEEWVAHPLAALEGATAIVARAIDEAGPPPTIMGT
jgi:tetratricopeptide (TPR) repeat protein/GTP-binding protein EngB required for normal cell division